MRNLDPDFMEAEDWKTMYIILHHAISDVVDEIGRLSKEEVTEILAKALIRAEEYYITVGDAMEGREEVPMTQARIDELFGFD